MAQIQRNAQHTYRAKRELRLPDRLPRLARLAGLVVLAPAVAATSPSLQSIQCDHLKELRKCQMPSDLRALSLHLPRFPPSYFSIRPKHLVHSANGASRWSMIEYHAELQLSIKAATLMREESTHLLVFYPAALRS